MYGIKQEPEDFRVDEVTNIEPKQSGEYSLWWMTKTNYNTMDAVVRIAKSLNIPAKFIGFAGTKDKRAVTKQLISISKVSKEKIEELKIKDIELEFFGHYDKPLSLGDLKGNKFRIIVSGVDDVPEAKNKMRNLYGEQRFSGQNAEIGKLIIKGDFKSAAEKIAESQDKVREHLEEKEKDYVGALRNIPKKILRIYVHAYQSLLWNKMAEKIEDDIDLPIIGFGTEFEDYKVEKIAQDLMDEEGIDYRDFIIREIPELSAEGGERRVFVDVEDLEIEKKENKIELRFFLPKGSYATVFVASLFS